MNVFYLHSDPKLCAQDHCDKHVVKMIVEYAQILSTTHRVLDGQEYIEGTANNRRIKRYRHPFNDDVLYKATHVNHPSTVWARQSLSHYDWLYELWIALLDEYSVRYKKTHATTRLSDALRVRPLALTGRGFNAPPQAMPYVYKRPDAVLAYREYYKGDKRRFATWKTQEPVWWKD